MTSGLALMIWKAFAAMGALLLVIVFIWIMVQNSGSVGGVMFYFFFYYYTALSLPAAVACWMFKPYDPASEAASNQDSGVPADTVATR